jgi:nucleoside-diphosphate-sugar epimerase
MKVLFVGGTGNISASCVRLALAQGMEVSVLTRGARSATDYLGDAKVSWINADIKDPTAVKAALGPKKFDAVADFISFVPDDIKRNIALFQQITAQYLFISSASAYQKPLVHPVITESTPLKNLFWQYSRDKIACEEMLNLAYREHDFPATIVRPSLTYDTVWPVAIGGWNDFTLVDRIRRGGEIIVHGDGTSLWTVTHAEDFARGFVGLLGNSAALGHSFHITSDEILTWDQIYTIVAETAGEKPRLVHISSEFLGQIDEAQKGNLLGDKAHSAIFDNTKIKRFVPGFTALIPFHVGARKTLAWFEAKKERQVIVPAINDAMDRYLREWRQAIRSGSAISR